MWTFVKRNREMGAVFSSSNLNNSRYYRLMSLAMLDTLLTIPFAAYTIWVNAAESPIAPWEGLANVHIDFGRVEQIPAVEWQLSHLFVVSVNISKWAIVFCAFLFFGFFGFAEESRRSYAKLYWTIAKRFGYYPKPARSTAFTGSSFVRTPNLANISANSTTGKGGLKVFVNKNEKTKRDSLLSSIADLDSAITVDEAFEERKDRSHDSLPESPNDLELGGLPNLSHANPPSGPHPSEALVLNFPTSPLRSPRPAHFGDNNV